MLLYLEVHRHSLLLAVNEYYSYTGQDVFLSVDVE